MPPPQNFGNMSNNFSLNDFNLSNQFLNFSNSSLRDKINWNQINNLN